MQHLPFISKSTSQENKSTCDNRGTVQQNVSATTKLKYYETVPHELFKNIIFSFENFSILQVPRATKFCRNLAPTFVHNS